MSAPASAACRPSPVTALTPPARRRLHHLVAARPQQRGNFEPIRPVPPMITVFVSSPLSRKPRQPPRCITRTSCKAPLWHAPL
jgi:hypothetical protein